MGYNTDFSGSLKIETPLTPEQVAYLQAFNKFRHTKRDVGLLIAEYKGAHGLDGNYGIEGEFFILDIGNDYGETKDRTMIDLNKEPAPHPGLWCQWTVDDDGTELRWDEGEKFYSYVEWLQYMIDKFFKPWGKVLNGVIKWRGEDFEDIGTIKVTDNIVKATDGWPN